MLFQIPAHHRGKSRKELKQELKDKLQRNTAYRLASSLSPSDCFCTQPGNACLGMAPPNTGWALWYQSRQSPIDIARGQSDLGNYLVEVPPSWDTSDWQYKQTCTDTILRATDIFLRPVLPFLILLSSPHGNTNFSLGKFNSQKQTSSTDPRYSEK
jgi:hypothetical protein